MSQQHDQDLQQEQQLLEHYRQHSQGKPSAALDALILAAARRQTQPPSRTQRLHAWLFGTGSHARWSVAFAGLATLGIGLSLTFNTREQIPASYDLASPIAAQAPMLREMAPAGPSDALVQGKAEVERKKSVADSTATFSASPPAAAMPRQAAPAKPAAPLPEQAVAETQAQQDATMQAAAQARLRVQVAQEQTRQAPAGLAETLAEESAPLGERLREVVRLRQEGQPALAEQLLQHLLLTYPHQDVRAELTRLEQAQD